MSITPRPGHSLTDLETAADAVIERLKREGPTAEEVQKATAGEELSFVRGLESNLGKAFQLANGAAIHGDPGYFRTEYQKTLAVTAADVQRVANKYLTQRPHRAERRADWARPTRRRSPQKARRSNDAPIFIVAAVHRRNVGCSVPWLWPGPQPGRRGVRPNSRSLETAAYRQDARAARAGLDESDAANGAELIVSEKHDLPLVSFSHHLPRRSRSVRSRPSGAASEA